MTYTKSTSSSKASSSPKTFSSKASDSPKHHVNWHEAAACAIEIELRDYAGLFIDQTSRAGSAEQYTSLNISITFLSFHYPGKLIKHLKKERNLTVAKSSPGVYYINKETFKIQIIVTRKLPSIAKCLS